MTDSSYLDRREKLEVYFDRTAAKTWEQLTSEAPVSRIRQTVRAGRDTMRAQLLSWLPDDLQGRHVLDAGCGTGALAVEAARRGAQVTAVDISASLIQVARQRTPDELIGQIDYRVGDMALDQQPLFDHVVAMDSVIHYTEQDMLDTIEALLRCLAPTDASLLFTFAPRTPLLMMMKHAGALFPRADRSPAIEPIAEHRLRRGIDATLLDGRARAGRTHRVDTRFYKSQAMEVRLT